MTSKWEMIGTSYKLPILHAPVLIEGLPGIGNVGKIAIDYMLENVKAKKVCDIISNTFPHSVFVNENNLVELPAISIYHKRVGKNDFLFLAGDLQPTEEVASYDFANFILDFFKKKNGLKVVTLGGIALSRVPVKPKVFCTGNDRAFIKEMTRDTGVNDKLYGVVGPIVGVSGLLLGLATPRKMQGVTLLAETLGHPMYLGMEGAHELLKVLDKKFKLKVDVSGFSKEIKHMEIEMRKKAKEIDDAQKASRKGKGKVQETSYIG